MNQTTRPERRQDISGEVLPPDDETSRALVPVNQNRPTPLVRIRLPEAQHEAEAVPLLEHEVRRPTRTPTLESDFIVPALQSVFSAVALGVGAALAAWALGWSWRVVALVGGGALALAWLWRMRVLDSLLWEIERFTGKDINHDGDVGEPASFSPVIVNAHEARQQAAHVQRSNESQRELEQLLAFVTRCANAGCSEGAQNIGTSPSARADFAAKRDTLIAVGVARWKDPDRRRIGWELTMSPAQAGVLLRRHIMGRDST